MSTCSSVKRLDATPRLSFATLLAQPSMTLALKVRFKRVICDHSNLAFPTHRTMGVFCLPNPQASSQLELTVLVPQERPSFGPGT